MDLSRLPQVAPLPQARMSPMDGESDMNPQKMAQRRPRWVIMTAAIAATIAACSPQAPGAGTTTHRSPAAAMAGSVVAQLSGAQLKSALLLRSGFPAGYVIYPKNSYDSGTRVQNPVTRYDLATVPCGTFYIVIGDAGFGETAMAVDEFANYKLLEGYMQFIYQFPQAGTASTFLAGLRTVTRRCLSFTASEYGVTQRLRAQVSATTAVSGHPAVRIHQTVTTAGSDDHTASQFDYLFVLDGADVYGTILFGVKSAPPASPSAPAIIARLTARVAALQ